MRRTFAYLLACLLMYCTYMHTLDLSAAETYPAAAQARINSTVSLSPVRMYAVSLGLFETQTEARPRAGMYTARGAAGCMVETDGGFELLGAIYPDEAEAASVCHRLNEAENIPARVVPCTADGIDISVTATSAQTDAIAAAIEFMEYVPGELIAISGRVDAGLCTPRTAVSLISVMLTEGLRLRDELSRELGVTADIFSRMVETGLIDMCDSLAYICSEDAPGGLMLSSLMKQCAIDTILYMINMQHTLSR